MVGKKFEIFKPVIWRGIRIRLSINKKKSVNKNSTEMWTEIGTEN